VPGAGAPQYNRRGLLPLYFQRACSILREHEAPHVKAGAVPEKAPTLQIKQQPQSRKRQRRKGKRGFFLKIFFAFCAFVVYLFPRKRAGRLF
jgi:hypothetical protein